MGRWLKEIKEHLGDQVIVHVVGTKTDITARDPTKRQVPFERCIAYVAENLHPEVAVTPPQTRAGASGGMSPGPGAGFWHVMGKQEPQPAEGNSKRNSGFWGQDLGWDICHEISASSGEGIEEVFRVITRKIVETAVRRAAEVEMVIGEDGLPTPRTADMSVAGSAGAAGYFDRPIDGNGSFRVGVGDKRRSWLGFPTPTFAPEEAEAFSNHVGVRKKKNGRCC